MHRPQRRHVWRALELVFLASGLSGLGSQMIWTRLLGLDLGHETAAALAVVTASFAGFAAGAWALGPWVRSTLRPARAYALLEVLIAAWMAGSAFLLPSITLAALRLLGTSPTPVWHWTLAFTTALLALFPATAAMGVTLPALERFAAQVTGRPDTAGPLYAANTAGGVLGTLLGAFLLIPAFGFRASLGWLALLPLLSAVATLALERRAAAPIRTTAHGAGLKPDNPASAPPQTSSSNSITPRRSSGSLSPARQAGTAFATGLLGIGTEVLGLRLLGQTLENTVYSLASVLAVFLIGTAIGASLETAWRPRRTVSERLRSLLYGLAVTTAVSGWAVWSTPRLAHFIERYLEPAGGSSRLLDLVLAMVVFAPSTLLMGATFSALARSAREQPGGLARTVSLNALGAAAAPLLFCVWLVPWIGSRWSLTAMAFAYAALAAPPRRARAGVWLGLLALTLPLPRWLPPLGPTLGGTVRTRLEGVTDTVTVTVTPDGHRTLRVNQRYTMGGTASANAERRQAHLPLLLHPQPRRALFLGTGTGLTCSAALAHPALEADGVELVPEVAAVMSEFAPENRWAEWFPRLRLHVADARRFVRATSNQYDVIVADLFHPARDGAGTLYTREHFAALRSRMASGGLCCQWLPLYQLDEPTLQVIMRTFLDVFPHTRAWLLRLTVDTPVIGLIGSLELRRYPSDWLERRVSDPALQASLKPLALTETQALLGLVLGGSDALRRYAQGAALNTDDRPVVMFSAPRRLNAPALPPAARLLALIERLEIDPPFLLDPATSPTGSAERLTRYVSARNAYLRGLSEEGEGRRDHALRLYLESVRLSPDFSTGYAHGLTLAVQQSSENPAAARQLLEQLSKLQPHRQAAQELLKRLDEGAP